MAASNPPALVKAGSVELIDKPAQQHQSAQLSLSSKHNSNDRIGIVFDDLTYKIVGKKKVEKTLISHVSGRVQPGRLTAIMGASGAGKTTFINLLSGRIKAGTDRLVTGAVRVNGVVTKDVQKISGYVMQEDVLLPHLTPREHLEFSAKMTLPASTTPQEISDRVESVLRSLRLTKCADTKVGNPLLKRGISGGERKRTSVGIELVGAPQLLFLDEPTSGLDSDTAASLVDILHNLAHTEGQTIACTIHQPSSDMFAQFDDLILLASGRIVYAGPASAALAHFASLGQQCGEHVNPAEFMLTLLHNAQQASANPESGHVNVAQLAEAWAKHSYIDPAWEKSLPSLDMRAKDKIGATRQLGLLTARCWQMIVRDPQATFMKLFQYIFVTVFASLLNLRLNDSGRGITGKAGDVFTILLLFSFIPAQGVILLFPNERPVFLREYTKGLYRPIVYFLAQNIAQMPFQIVFPVICAAINYGIVGLRSGFQHYVLFALVAVLTFMIGTSIGMLVGAALADVGKGMEIGPTLIIPQMLVAGLFVTTKSMPVWIRWMQYISFVHWGWAANMQNEFKNRAVECSDRAVNCSGNDLLDFYALDSTSYGLAVGMLVVLVVVYRLIAYVLLHLSAHRAKGRN